MNGYIGKFLEVDLTSGKTVVFSVGDEILRDFVGGVGLAAKLYFDRFQPPAEPLSPDNPLFLFTGPLTGVRFGGASRFAAASRSPLTGIWGYGSAGGEFGPELKKAGFDGILLTGAAASPTYLFIEDGLVELRDAGDLWGLNTYETHDALGSRTGGKGKVCCIGQAGENLVKMACLSGGKHDYVGRSGMGAVMGSKKLKAVQVVGSGTVEVHDPEAMKQLARSCVKKAQESMPGQSMRMMGTAAAMDLGMMTGDIPIQNWSVGEDYELSGSLGGPAINEDYLTGRHSCWACTVACKRVVEVKEGPYKVPPKSVGPEYETLCSFGTQLRSPDLAGVIKANEKVNQYGMDTISLGNTIAFAFDCFEKGLITEADTGGLTLNWSNMEAAHKLVDMTANREGLGDLIAEGSREMARRLKAEHLSCEIKGLEAPMHDPRGSHGLALAYMMSNRGACHMQHVAECVEHGIAVWTELGFSDDYPGPVSEGKAEMVKLAEDFGVPFNSLCICQFDMWCYDSGDLVEAVKAVTGWDFTIEELLKLGARTWLMERALNNIFGISNEDDRLPQKLMTPLEEGTAAGSVPDPKLMLDEYYKLRGLEQDGRPGRAVLEAHGLGEVASALNK